MIKWHRIQFLKIHWSVGLLASPAWSTRYMFLLIRWIENIRSSPGQLHSQWRWLASPLCTVHRCETRSDERWHAHCVQSTDARLAVMSAGMPTVYSPRMRDSKWCALAGPLCTVHGCETRCDERWQANCVQIHGCETPIHWRTNRSIVLGSIPCYRLKSLRSINYSSSRELLAGVGCVNKTFGDIVVLKLCLSGETGPSKYHC